ncbi:MAG: hypothetical protein NEHIOOID_00095 [Holosporales bacterium]
MSDLYLKKRKIQKKIFSLSLSLMIVNVPIHANNSIAEDPSWDLLSSISFTEESEKTTVNPEKMIETYQAEDVANFAEYADGAYKLAKKEQVSIPLSSHTKVIEFKSDDSSRYGRYMGDNFGYVTTRQDGKVIVSFKGTTSMQNAFTDGLFFWGNLNGGSYHRGILNAYLSVQSSLLKILEDLATERKTDLQSILKETFFTGHSLGGGMAIIAADQLRRQGYDLSGVVTFAAPKVMDNTTVRAYDNALQNKTLAVEQVTDPVPVLNPFTWFSSQVGQVLKVPFYKGVTQHKLSGYKNAINAFTQSSSISATRFIPSLSWGTKTVDYKFEKNDKDESRLYNAVSWVGKTFLSPLKLRLR